MQNKRRNFLHTAGIVTAGSLLMPNWACSNGSQESKDTSDATDQTMTSTPSLENFGIQLYTLRGIIYEEPKATIAALAPMGFSQIESYEGDLGIFWGMPHTDFKKFLDDLGMKVVSSHCDIYKDFERKAAQAAEIGMEYLICPSIGAQTSVEKWKNVTEKFNECGEICRKNGIKFAYHNHAYSFKAFTGMIPHEFMMENTDPELVDFEMDIYWVVTGGADPVDYLTRYPNRFRLCHVKDRMKTAAPGEEGTSCNLGTGSIDFPSILKVAADNGMQYYIMEQERYDDSTPMKSAAAGAEYLKKLVFA